MPNAFQRFLLDPISNGFEKITGPKPLGSHLPVLDGIRGLAILVVVVSHARNSPGFERSIFAFTEPFHWGTLGVQMFFVLSGFLITSLLLQENDKNGKISLKHFYIRRSLRIFPLLYLYLIFIVGFAAYENISLSTGLIVSVALYVQNFNWFGGFGWLNHTWSLGIEEQFYLIWPSLAIWGIRHKKNITGIILFMIVLCPFIRLFSPHSHFISTYLVEAFNSHCDQLLIGILAALLLREQTLLHAAKKIGHKNLLYISIAILILTSYRIRNYLVADFFANTLISLSFAWLILYVILYPDSATGRFFSSRVMVWLGIYSYSLYVWQEFFLIPVLNHIFWWNYFPYNILMSFGVAFLSFNLFEKHFLKLKDKFK